ncbi:MAG TPA: hypothetical protein VND19_23205 [Acetobacteraceae bacterium]|nr:hypothetical protein [Acetobacteraceae bacterium]
MSLAHSENSSQRFYGFSGQIRRDHSSYYESLERAQKGDLDLTARLLWFIECFSQMLDAVECACAGVLHKAEFWHRHALLSLNERQRAILDRCLDGFEGKLTAKNGWRSQVLDADSATGHQGPDRARRSCSPRRRQQEHQLRCHRAVAGSPGARKRQGIGRDRRAPAPSTVIGACDARRFR